MTERKQQKILVVFSNIDVSHRKMLGGILRYAREKCSPPWDVQLDLRDLGRRSHTALREGGFSGIIAAVINPDDRKRYFATGLPTVLFEPTLARMNSAKRPANNITFFNDHAAEGCAAARYFLERGYRSFAYVGTPSPLAWSLARRRGFVSTLNLSGFHTCVYKPPSGVSASNFIRESKHLEKWLRKLPERTAVFAAHDERARQITVAARRAGIRIPDQIALLGVDDDELLCSTADPSISSIHVPSEEEGWRLAEAMSSLLAGRNTTPVFRTCHTRVITRLSTDAFAIADPFVTKAIAYAEKHLAESLGGEVLASAANCSLRTLQHRVLHTLGRTIREEIAHLRESAALQLLRETKTPIAEVARVCGFCSPSHLGTRIKRKTGQKPLAIRFAARQAESRPSTAR